MEAWWLKNYTQKEEWYSDDVAIVVVPAYINSKNIVKGMWKRCNLILGLGLNKLVGKMFKIGHLRRLTEVKFFPT